MNPFVLLYIAVFAAAFLIALAAVPVCKKIARATGYLDVPKSEAHKRHGQATPLLGGAAIAVGWFITLAAGAGLCAGNTKILSDFPGFADGLRSSVCELAVIVLCALASLVLGLIDDKHPLKAQYKFGGQFLIALAAVLFGGLKISLFIPSEIFSCAVTVFWLLFIFNATNFFDNMDGLAAGMAVIAFGVFTIAAAANGQFLVASLSACSAGACAGFWVFNADPASMFMGDAGSHFIGFLLGVTSVKVTYYNPAVASSRFAVLIPLFILAVPIFDAFAVVAIRLYHHKPVYVGDNNHISHRFLKMGFSRKMSVAMVHLLCLSMGLGALPILWGDLKTCMILFAQCAVFLLILSLMQAVGRNSADTQTTEVKHVEKE